MIDNQRRVNNGVKEHLKARQQLLAVEEVIAGTEKLVADTKKEIAKLDKERATANKKRQKEIKKEVRFLKEFNAENERTVDIQKKEKDELKKTLSLRKAMGNEFKKQVISLNKELFNTTLKFINQELAKDTVTKIFMYNIPSPKVTTKTEKSNINVEKVLPDCDNLIVTYRENILSTYISETKALQNHLWYVSQSTNTDKLLESQDLKIEWNKEHYLKRFNSVTFWNNELYKLYKMIDP